MFFELRNARKRIDNKTIFKDLNLTVYNSGIYGLIGNKTISYTLVDIITEKLFLDKGELVSDLTFFSPAFVTRGYFEIVSIDTIFKQVKIIYPEFDITNAFTILKSVIENYNTLKQLKNYTVEEKHIINAIITLLIPNKIMILHKVENEIILKLLKETQKTLNNCVIVISEEYENYFEYLIDLKNPSIQNYYTVYGDSKNLYLYKKDKIVIYEDAFKLVLLGELNDPLELEKLGLRGEE